jgi:AMP nucleosidase
MNVKKKAKSKTKKKSGQNRVTKRVSKRKVPLELEPAISLGFDQAHSGLNPHSADGNKAPYKKKEDLLRSRRIFGNEDKRKIAIDMLERYTGHSIEDFQKQIILTNFQYYIERFNVLLPDAIYTKGSAFQASSSKKAQVTIIVFGVGSAMAALVGELISVVEPKAVLFLGLCGAVHRSLKVGDFILPIAAIRAEGVSTHFMPPQVPALPTFKVQKFVSQILVEHGYEYRTGTVHSTDYRFWEFDDRFKENLVEERVLAVEMETAALFVSCFISKVNIGAVLLVSDCPMNREGIKTKKSASEVFRKYTDIHIELGIEAMADIADRGEKIRHYTW